MCVFDGRVKERESKKVSGFLSRGNRNKETCSALNIQTLSVCALSLSLSGPTMKLKRPVVLKMYKEQIENFYKDAVTPSNPENPLSSK